MPSFRVRIAVNCTPQNHSEIELEVSAKDGEEAVSYARRFIHIDAKCLHNADDPIVRRSINYNFYNCKSCGEEYKVLD